MVCQKRNLTKECKDLKDQGNSSSYLFKIFDLVKIEKILSRKKSKLSDRCTAIPIPLRKAGAQSILKRREIK